MEKKRSLMFLALKYAKPYIFWYMGALIFLALSTWISFLIPQVIWQAIDYMDEAFDKSFLVSLSGWIILLGITQMFVRSLSRILIFWPGRKIEGDLKTDIFHSFLSYPLSFWDDHPRARAMSHLSFDSAQLRMFFAFVVLQGSNFCFLFGFLVYNMAMIHQKLVFVVLMPLGLTLLWTRVFSSRMYRLSLASQENMAYLSQSLSDTFSQVVAIQTLGAQWAFMEQINICNEKVIQGYKNISLLRSMTAPVVQYLTQWAYLLVLFFGGYLILQGELTLGQLMAFHMYVGLLSFPLMALGFCIAIYHRAKAAAEKTKAYLDQTIVSQQFWIPEKALLPGENLIQVMGVLLPKQHQPFGLDIQVGEKIGMTGRIGTGKTTLLNQLGGLKRPESRGHFFFQGQDFLDIPEACYRKIVGYGLQVPYFFSGTVRENLEFGLMDLCSEEKLKEALEFSCLWNEVLNFSHGLDTLLGEKGLKLSGGQKQRMALARLYLRDPMIWILDDVTSALDEKTEKKILESLSTLKKTVILVSHRPLTLSLCDRIIHL